MSRIAIVVALEREVRPLIKQWRASEKEGNSRLALSQLSRSGVDDGSPAEGASANEELFSSGQCHSNVPPRLWDGHPAGEIGCPLCAS